MLSNDTITTIKSTVPLLEEHGLDITKAFYKLLFEANPELKNIFNMNKQRDASQATALADAVLAYAANIDNLGALLPAVKRIAAKHASIGIQSHHYPLVGASLLQAIQNVLSLPDKHPALIAWGEAYGFLAEVFINSESDLYTASKDIAGGWNEFRPFEIQEVITETPEVQSYILRAQDGKAIQAFLGGQFVSVKVASQEQGFDQIRQYSLSDWSNGELASYRITVKSEPKGDISNKLHKHAVGDVLQLSSPQGDFILNTKAKKHVFISGGVGITPLFAMLKQAVAGGMNNEQLQFIECCRGTEHQIFKEELTALSNDGSVSLKHAFAEGDEGDWSGRLNATILKEWITDTSADVYFCGPAAFMSALKTLLNDLGFNDDQLHYEVFGATIAI